MRRQGVTSRPRPRKPFAGLDRIICGDVLDVLAAVPRQSVHLIITSPPYNLDKDYEEHSDDLEDRAYLAWMKKVWRAAIKTLVPGGRLCINIGENKRQYISNPTYSAFIQQLVSLKMLYRGTIIWNKHSAAKHCAWGSWKSPSNPHLVPRHEYILAFSKGQWKLDGDKADSDISDKEFMSCTRSVWVFGTESKKRVGHPAPFPETLPERLIKFYSYRGHTVLDPFGGSGTVAVVAARLGRHFIHGDNSPQYCELARKRLTEAHGLFLDPRIIPVEEL
ncbi:MAG: site-specific DNA-methyltransferase [Candidatus Brocadiae bacterium]|nr:site-specific DNA-methyltransferase [Candidatus Brocadiia bacterium]